jgi:hypothetical protein
MVFDSPHLWRGCQLATSIQCANCSSIFFNSMRPGIVICTLAFQLLNFSAFKNSRMEAEAFHCVHCSQSYSDRSTVYRHKANFQKFQHCHWRSRTAFQNNNSEDSGSESDADFRAKKPFRVVNHDDMLIQVPSSMQEQEAHKVINQPKIVEEKDDVAMESESDDELQQFEVFDDNDPSDNKSSSSSSSSDSEPDSSQSHRGQKVNFSEIPPLQYKLSFFILVWSYVFNIPFEAVSLLWKIICWAVPDSIFSYIAIRRLRQKLFERAVKSQNYVVCPGCSKLHKHQDCITITRQNGRKTFTSKKCTECQFVLLESIDGIKSRKLRAKKLFPYASVIANLRQFMARSDFEELCQQWKHRQVFLVFLFTRIHCFSFPMPTAEASRDNGRCLRRKSLAKLFAPQWSSFFGRHFQFCLHAQH